MKSGKNAGSRGGLTETGTASVDMAPKLNQKSFHERYSNL